MIHINITHMHLYQCSFKDFKSAFECKPQLKLIKKKNIK